MATKAALSVLLALIRIARGKLFQKHLSKCPAVENELTSKRSVRIYAIRVHRTTLEVSLMKLVGMHLVDLGERIGRT